MHHFDHRGSISTERTSLSEWSSKRGDSLDMLPEEDVVEKPKLVKKTRGSYKLSDFLIQRTLGTGSFGRVHLVQSKHNLRFYAIKVLNKEKVVKMKQEAHTNNEQQILECIQHPFIVNLWGTFQDCTNLYMVMDFVPGGELFTLLRRSNRFPDPVAKFYAAEVALALNYLHSLDIIYRDLKPENILLNIDGHIKVADFGFAKACEVTTWTLCGTPDYLAPEIISQQRYNKSVDWYALGILIFEMLSGLPPFHEPDSSPFQLYQKIARGPVCIRWPNFNPLATDLIWKLLEGDPTKRYGNLRHGAGDVFAHPWFREVDWERLAAREITAPYLPKVARDGDASAFELYAEDNSAEFYGREAVDQYGHLFSGFEYTQFLVIFNISSNSSRWEKVDMVDRKGKGKAKAVVEDSLADGEVSEGVLSAERSALLAQKQSEMEVVSDRHDTMVRELFHMTQFVDMLGYDPSFKTDRGHDLLDQASTISAGPAVRRTRRTMNERQQALHTTAVSVPITPLKSKKKLKPQSSSEPVHRDDAVPEEPQTARSTKETRSLSRPNAASRHSATSNSSPVKLVDPNSSPSSRCITVYKNPRRKPTATTETCHPLLAHPDLATSATANPPSDLPELISSRHGPSRSKVRKAPISTGIPDDPPRKRRKTEPTPLLANPINDSANPFTPDSLSTRVTKRASPPTVLNGNVESSPLGRRRTRSQYVTPAEVLPLPPPLPPEKPQLPILNIKRIKLLVRRPPPMLSHPRQRPGMPKHNSSLKSFLASYHTLDGEDIHPEDLEKNATRDAEIYEQEILFRNQGRFIPGTDVVFGTKPQHTPFTTPQRNSTDVWDSVVAEVIAHFRRRPKKPLGLHVSSQVAAKVQGYWDAQATKKDRAKAQEEKQIRALAKSTSKLVMAEWKRIIAASHIREEERLQQEAEDLKRGAEHLDAILDQSGFILEAQQGDLSRGGALRSRSRSIHSSTYSDDGEAGVDSDDEDEEDEDQDNQASIPVDISSPEPSASIDPDETEPDGSDSEDLGASALIPDLPRPAVPPPLSDVDALETPEASSDLPHPSPSIAPSSPIHDSMDDTVVEDIDHPPRKLQPSSPLDTTSLDPIPSVDDDMAGDLPVGTVNSPLPTMDIVVSTPKAPTLADDAAPSTPASQATVLDHVLDVDDNDVDEQTEVLDETYSDIPHYLQPYAVAPMQWDPQEKIKPPLLLRGILRPYQQAGLEWLASLHTNNLNGILADEMGLGKTIQTIALLAHLACDRGIWGPHLIIVPTSVLLNWEMEFKKFLPGFKVLSYHGSTKRRKELRQGWNDKYHFNVCITSYTLASRDAHIFKRKAIYYMILDEAHMIKNFRSQRWNILLGFRSFRRLLLTGTPLQNNLTELWALLQFLMSGSNFANLKEFDEWFSNPLEKMIEMGQAPDEEAMQRVTKLHTVLRPYLLRRLKRDVEKELPSKYEHLVLCPLSKRQRFLYDEFMSRAHTRDALESGVYQKIANILMQLRKVCNHPDLFEVRPIVTSFAMPRSAIADFEIKELLIRRRMFSNADSLDLDLLGLQFIGQQGSSSLITGEVQALDATTHLPFIMELPGEPPPKDTRTIVGFKAYEAWRQRAETISHWKYLGYLNRLRCRRPPPVISYEILQFFGNAAPPLLPAAHVDFKTRYLEDPRVTNKMVKTYAQRELDMGSLIDRFAFTTPPVVALDIPRIALAGYEDELHRQEPAFDATLHRSSVKLQIAFPDPSLLQYDCGKLQQLARLLRDKKIGGHRCLIFTQMTKVLDILEIFMNLHGYLYLRLDGATKIEDRQYITERFNVDARIFCFISSSRSGGVGINLTGADTVIFYDSDFNPQMDRQCEDRAHRIGQIRDVHIYRFVSQYTVEEAMLRKANQKRSLDDLVIQKGEFDWRSLFSDEGALTQALGQVEDTEDAHAADVAAREEVDLEGADDADFGEDGDHDGSSRLREDKTKPPNPVADDPEAVEADGDGEEEGGTVVEYMLQFVRADYDFFKGLA
ncbi:hypothetical protein ONZ45_g5314 [Pleurotus djamor]|nr:hypothetical protein ONZ45_g5314 [Pleurotus djamor]